MQSVSVLVNSQQLMHPVRALFDTKRDSKFKQYILENSVLQAVLSIERFPKGL